MEIRLFSLSRHRFQVFLVLRSNTAWLCLNCKVVKAKLKTVLVKIIHLKPHSSWSKYTSLALHQKSSLKQVLSRVSQVIRVVPLTLQRDFCLDETCSFSGTSKAESRIKALVSSLQSPVPALACCRENRRLVAIFCQQRGAAQSPSETEDVAKGFKACLWTLQ